MSTDQFLVAPVLCLSVTTLMACSAGLTAISELYQHEKDVPLPIILLNDFLMYGASASFLFTTAIGVGILDLIVSLAANPSKAYNNFIATSTNIINTVEENSFEHCLKEYTKENCWLWRDSVGCFLWHDRESYELGIQFCSYEIKELSGNITKNN